MKKLRFYWITILFVLLISIIGFLLGSMLTIKVFQKSDYIMFNYACMDGCSIATKDSNGWLTNSTFDCWEKCKSYVNEFNPYIFNISSLNYKRIGEYCKEKEPKDYKLNVWWDGCSGSRGVIKFTCGYINKDGASKYDCYEITELLK